MNNKVNVTNCLSLLVSLLAILLLSPTAAAQEKMRIIVDTDARAEIDDQAAITYALFSGNHFEVEGITVNRGSDGPHRTDRDQDIDDHFNEAVTVARLCASSNVPVLKGPAGNCRSVKDHVHNPTFDGSDAVNFIIQRAHATSSRKLNIYADGNLTNVALALLKDPTIANRIVVWWMGTWHPANFPDNNMAGDLDAAAALFANPQNVPLHIMPWNIPNMGTTWDEYSQRMRGRGPNISSAVSTRYGPYTRVGDYLAELFNRHVGAKQKENGRSILDVVGFAVLKNNVGQFTPSETGAPSLNYQSSTGSERHGAIPLTWSNNPGNPRRVTIWRNPNRDAVYNDFFNTMDNYVLAGPAAAQDMSTQAASTARAEAIVPLDGPVLAGKPVTFKLSGNPGNPHWKLGDGATADGSSVTHTYQKPGVYRVVMGSKAGDTFNELSSAIVRVHTPETLHLPQIVLDTDARNEIDDQHYIAYALFSELDVLGINSVHHTRWADNETQLTRGIGTEKYNYDEILNILDLAKKSGLSAARVPMVFRGAAEPLKTPSSRKWYDTKPIVTQASEAILAAARGASPDNPVWVLPVGPCSNIASAILQVRQEGWEAEFNRRIRVCWLGGGPKSINRNTFNGSNDPWSAWLTFKSGIEFVMFLEYPAGASILFDPQTDYPLYPSNPLGDYLKAIMTDYFKRDYMKNRPRKELFDMGVLSLVIGKHLERPWLKREEPSILLNREQGYEYRSTTEPTNLDIVWAVDHEAMAKDFFDTLNGKPTALPPKKQ